MGKVKEALKEDFDKELAKEEVRKEYDDWNSSLQTQVIHDNMVIWNKVCVTDPDSTKEATGKGFLCTSINPQSVWEKLTKLFGPCGIGWGYEVMQEDYRAGHTDGENTVILHVLQVGLWFVLGGKKSALIPAYGQTFLVKNQAKGWATDEEAPKKSLTDALGKAASMIGVSADIYSGKWDGHKDQTKRPTPTKTLADSETSNCPKCGKNTVIPSKFASGGFFCFMKKGGCGEKFKDRPKIEEPKCGEDDVPLGKPPEADSETEDIKTSIIDFILQNTNEDERVEAFRQYAVKALGPSGASAKLDDLTKPQLKKFWKELQKPEVAK